MFIFKRDYFFQFICYIIISSYKILLINFFTILYVYNIIFYLINMVILKRNHAVVTTQKNKKIKNKFFPLF